jgi:hypothetical protein
MKAQVVEPKRRRRKRGVRSRTRSSWDFMNNAATAAVMCPTAIGAAAQIGASADPFLMAVAVGAPCALLTPIGHQNNTLILGPGGFRFGDYWRLGLPLEIIVIRGERARDPAGLAPVNVADVFNPERLPGDRWGKRPAGERDASVDATHWRRHCERALP